MENQTAEIMQGQPIPDTIQSITIEDIKKDLFEELKDGFEFSPSEYTPGPDSKKQSIFLKIANVMGGLDRVPKSGYNKNHDYKYVTESDVVGAVRPLMAKEKLIMMPSIKRYKESEIATKYSRLYMGTIEIEWILRDAESYETVTMTMIGKGTDTLEKDIYKAISGNKKYALISLFMIDSGDDPERNDSPVGEGPPQNGQNGGQNQQNGSRGTNTPQGNQKRDTGNSGQNQTQPQDKQPSKTDLLTRWVVLEGETTKTKKVVREEFDKWYQKKLDDKWDHKAMLTVLTKKIKEKNDAMNAVKDGAGKADKSDKADEKKDDSVPDDSKSTEENQS